MPRRLRFSSSSFLTISIVALVLIVFFSLSPYKYIIHALNLDFAQSMQKKKKKKSEEGDEINKHNFVKLELAEFLFSSFLLF